MKIYSSWKQNRSNRLKCAFTLKRCFEAPRPYPRMQIKKPSGCWLRKASLWGECLLSDSTLSSPPTRSYWNIYLRKIKTRRNRQTPSRKKEVPHEVSRTLVWHLYYNTLPKKEKNGFSASCAFLPQNSQLVFNLHTFSALFRIKLHILTRLGIVNTSALSFVPLYRNSSLFQKNYPVLRFALYFYSSTEKWSKWTERVAHWKLKNNLRLPNWKPGGVICVTL